MSLVLELEKKIVDVLVRGSVVVESEDLESKTGWLERGEEGQILGFFVLESCEESSIDVDGKLEVDIIESDG